MPMYQRPPFWRVPRSKPDPDFVVKRGPHKQGKAEYDQQSYSVPRDHPQEVNIPPSQPPFIVKKEYEQANAHLHQQLLKKVPQQQQIVYPPPAPFNVKREYGQQHVTPGTPAGRELVRGDIIAKIDDYDARDLRHEDAQNLFKNASNQIRIVVQRDVDREASRGAAQAPRSPIPLNVAPPSFRTPSPLPPTPMPWSGKGPESLPRTPIPSQGQFPVQFEGDYRTYMLSPSSIRTDETYDESITTQPYRTTPLVLPGAKVRREPGPTESYLRHHPNPAMRAPPHHDYRDTLMKQKVAHKQYNSPINLYSEQNIANTIRQQSSPLPHKPTLLYDPAKSETFRALQEEGLGDVVQEVPVPVTPKFFTAPPNKRPAPTPKPKQPEANSKGKQTTFVNSLHEEHIQQSNSFKRLMYNVLGDTEF